MKKNMFKLQHIFFALLVAVAMVSCSEKELPTPQPQEPELEFTQEELAEMAAVDRFAAANSVYRALALLNELPDNWESATYTPAEGVAVDEANSDIRNVISTGAEQAKQYFLSIVPDLGLDGDTWSHEGVGTLTFKAVNEDNCYAVIDVNLVQMPGLKQLRFVPESVVGENKWQGTPYYGVGDIVKDKKGIYWICVRPSGGPLAKDNAYFVSFDESLIKTYDQKQDMYEVTGVGTEVKKTKTKVEYPEAWQASKWQYAKNLVEERIALAAAHVFAYLADAEYFYDLEVEGAGAFLSKITDMKECFDPSLLSKTGVGERKIFYVAYGSYQSSSKKHTQVKYLQPILSFSLDQNNEGVLQQSVEKAWPEDPTDMAFASSNLLSLTDTHDPFTNAYYLFEANEYRPVPYSIFDYTLTYTPNNDPQFSRWHDEKVMFMPGRFGENVPLVMTQMSLKDHGKPASGYELVSPEYAPTVQPDYWGSIANAVRVVFEKGQEGVEVPVTE